MGRRPKEMAPDTVSRILELRKKGYSYNYIGEEVNVYPLRVKLVCCSEGLDTTKIYKPRNTHLRKYDGFTKYGNLPNYVKKKFKNFYDKNNIITAAVLDNANIRPFVKNYAKPLGLKAR